MKQAIICIENASIPFWVISEYVAGLDKFKADSFITNLCCEVQTIKNDIASYILFSDDSAEIKSFIKYKLMQAKHLLDVAGSVYRLDKNNSIKAANYNKSLVIYKVLLDIYTIIGGEENV